MTEKEPLLAGVVSGRRFAVAEVDGFRRNGWTILPGMLTQPSREKETPPQSSNPVAVSR